MKSLFCLFAVIASVCLQTVDAQELETITQDPTVHAMVPNHPSFGEKSEDLQLFIQKNSRIPTLVKSSETSRNVISRVIIEPDGAVTFENILRSPDEQLSAEAKRIIALLPKFNPGTMDDGGSVRVYYMIPFWFE
jgi:periplasmic protein TonB